MHAWLRVKGREFRSRLLLGAELYDSAKLIGEVLEAGGCDVFITTLDLGSGRAGVALSELARFVDVDTFTWVGTTSFARSGAEALKTARLLHESFGIEIVKLDVRDVANLPDGPATVTVAEQLLADGFAVLPLVDADPGLVTRLADAGCAAVRVVASPVGSGRGIVDERALLSVLEVATVPIVVECGIGSVAHAARALELGADAVLVNTAVATARDPAGLAAAMRHAVQAGRLSATAH
ncbi:beta/alpha barrel domain-containing protein [Amycolatopsis magusensis]|uniref:thiazole synthase n=1 Tax=Amycolatopsis magusensis TaxID=882444 RepID=A0ABS4PR52_9PSEU|nr:thiazole synthase [Amycolatopsis magusensis]MBP2181894.1 thiazole synthase [Amycolatopsis magusensis]